MSLDPTKELGKLIGQGIQNQSDISSQIRPDEANDSLLLNQTASFLLTGTIIATSQVLASTAFVIDHAVYGDINSASLAIDGNYGPGSATLYTYTF